MCVKKWYLFWTKVLGWNKINVISIDLLLYLLVYINIILQSDKICISLTSSLYWLWRESFFYKYLPFHLSVVSNIQVSTSSTKSFLHQSSEFFILSFISSDKFKLCLEQYWRPQRQKCLTPTFYTFEI
jgi:hypothetical protein